MLNIYNTTSQTVAADSAVVFSTVGLSTSCGTEFSAGSDTITIERPGYYMIQFNGDASTTTTSPTTNITFQLYNGSNVVDAAEASSYSAAAIDTQNFKFATVIKVIKSCPMVDNSAVLTIKNIGTEATVTNANLVVTRLGGC